MASIELTVNKNNVSENKAIVKLTALGFTIPSSSYETVYSNSILEYSTDGWDWNTMSGDQADITFSNLSKGTEYVKTIWCQIKCQRDYYECEYGINNNGDLVLISREFLYTDTYYGDPINENISFYTHPGSFDMGATTNPTSSNNIIANVLSAEKINTLWIPHFNAAYRWWNQKDVKYSVDLSVTANAPVTATWFNKCMVAMNELGKNYKTNYEGGPNGDIITATVINQMNFSGKN